MTITETRFLRWWRDTNAMRFALKLPAMTGGEAKRVWAEMQRELVG